MPKINATPDFYFDLIPMKSPLISVSEADALLAGQGVPYPVETVNLASATGRVLREAIRADREYPALDRSRMDGIAIDFAAWDRGIREFKVTGMVRAGVERGRLDDASGCVELMTGAPVPLGADTVIPYEALESREFGASGTATVASDATVARGQNIHPQGSDCARGEVLVEAGERLSAVRIAAAASMGYSTLQVTRRPRISILTTGDELVEVNETPKPHQIRMSNGPALRALFEAFEAGAPGLTLASVGDDEGALRASLASALSSSDVLMVTGGVSAGKFDSVPKILQELGVTPVFHKIAQKPGKPLWFGTGPQGQLVFGLPGNPVSALVCARRYVIPLLQAKSAAKANVGVSATSGAIPIHFPEVRTLAPSHLTRFVPVRVSIDPATGMRTAKASELNGSGDFSRLGRSDGFVEIPSLPRGEIMAFFGWET